MPQLASLDSPLDQASDQDVDQDVDHGVAPIEHRLAKWTADQRRSRLREMVELASRPGVVSLAGGLPDPALFPVDEYRRAVSEALLSDRRNLQYRPPNRRLKEQVAELMTLRGAPCEVDQIVITSGAQQGIDLLARLFLEPGGEVALEAITFPGALQAVTPLRPRLLAISTDLETGLAVDELADLLERGHRPAFLYMIPDAHNPLGVSLSSAVRQRLADLVSSRGLPVIEDDPYGLLAYDGPFAPPLLALAPDWVCYVGSFSKILAPGLRLGWVVVPKSMVNPTTIAKEASDLECSALTQAAVSRLLEGDFFAGHLERLRSVYRERRDAMLGALERSMPSGTRWTRPRGGMFVWLEAPREVDSQVLFQRCVEEAGVAFVPGPALAHGDLARSDPAHSCMRLTFATLEPQPLERAVEALAACLGRTLETLS